MVTRSYPQDAGSKPKVSGTKGSLTTKTIYQLSKIRLEIIIIAFKDYHDL